MTIQFPSLNHSQEHAYTAHNNRTDLWDSAYRASRPLAYWSGYFLTYGDGMVQHSHESVVCAPLFEDYCASLAAHLLEHPDDGETLARVWPSALSDSHERFCRDVSFALSVRFKAGGKIAYYNLREQKISTRDSLRHDKRWQEVQDWMDGGANSAYRILRGDYREEGVIECYSLYNLCREARAAETNSWDEHPVDYFGLDIDRRTVIQQAFDAADYCVRSWRAREAAKLQLDCYRSNTKRRETIPSA